jgi:hypothetical protein
MWHERGWWNTQAGKMERHRANSICFFNGKNYIGDFQNGNVYELSYDDFTDNGNPVRRIRVGSHIHGDRKRLFFPKVELDFERGIGQGNPAVAGEQGVDPQLMLQWSSDGGFNWSGEAWRSPGPAGVYRQRAKFHRLGQSRDRVFKLTVSDPNKFVLISATADVQSE